MTQATPAQALGVLALGSSPKERRAAAIAIVSQSMTIGPRATPASERLAIVLEEAWRDTQAPHGELSAGLVETILTDPGLLTIEIAANALALEGEDGVTELLTLGRHPDFAIRSKVVIGLSLLGRSARWAVPTLIRFLEKEPVEYVARLIIATLGRISGPEAIATLERLASAAEGDDSWELAAEIKAALEQTTAVDLRTGDTESDLGAGEKDDDLDDDLEEEDDPWQNVSAADVAAAIDRALTRDHHEAPPSGRVFVPVGEVSLRSALLAAVPANDEEMQLAAEDTLDNVGIEETFSRFTGTPPDKVVYCCVSSSMVSGCWGVFEFRLGDRGYLYYHPDWGIGDDESLPVLGAWEPAGDPPARRACILSVYAREWHERVLPPAMGEWATGEPELLLEAILRVLDATPQAWEAVFERLQQAPEPREPAAQTVEEIANLSAAPTELVQHILNLVAARDDQFEEGIGTGASRGEERRIVVALFVHCIARDPFGF
jgi:hypothetical protein